MEQIPGPSLINSRKKLCVEIVCVRVTLMVLRGVVRKNYVTTALSTCTVLAKTTFFLGSGAR